MTLGLKMDLVFIAERSRMSGHRGRGRGGGTGNTRARSWAFTINNYTAVPAALPENARYLIVGEEVSASGTPHLQGYVVFKNPVMNPHRYFRQYGQGLFQLAQGDPDQNIEYCKKGDNFHEFEAPDGRPKNPKEQGQHGRIRAQLVKEEWEQAWQLARQGRIEKISPRKRIRYLSTWTKVQSLYQPKLNCTPELKNLWIHGPSGSGKSRWVNMTYPHCFRKLNSKWWDGYNANDPDHKVVLCEDLHPDTWADIPQLKVWADHYPFAAEVKGSSMTIRPDKIIVTSNYTPEQCFRRTEDVVPIRRRFRVVTVEDLPPLPVQVERGEAGPGTQQRLQDMQDQLEAGPSKRQRIEEPTDPQQQQQVGEPGRDEETDSSFGDSHVEDKDEQKVLTGEEPMEQQQTVEEPERHQLVQEGEGEMTMQEIRRRLFL